MYARVEVTDGRCRKRQINEERILIDERRYSVTKLNKDGKKRHAATKKKKRTRRKKE